MCELVVLRNYYHTVLTVTQHAGSGFSHIGEQDTEFWMEYTVYVDLGIDATKVSMRCEDNRIIVSVPHSQILGDIHVVTSSVEDIVAPPSRWYINDVEITAEDITDAMNDSKEDIRDGIIEDGYMFENADERVKSVITCYIDTVLQNSGVSYQIEFEYVENEVDEDRIDVLF